MMLINWIAIERQLAKKELRDSSKFLISLRDVRIAMFYVGLIIFLLTCRCCSVG